LQVTRQSIATTRAEIVNGVTTCAKLLEQSLTLINEGKDTNAFISILGKSATKQAESVDRKLRSNQAGKLAGAILAVKDNIAIKGERLTCGSRMLENYISPYSATVIDHLLTEDAILIGKANMDEFAMGSSNENSYFGVLRNPFSENRVPGGSSGGACVAVATGLVNAAIASDTGGSIRQPASFCGVVGLKPTYGRVSRFGLTAFASSFDQIGPVTTSVEDAALLLEVMAGSDRRDATSVDLSVPNFVASLDNDVARLRIGIPKEYFADGLDPEVRAAVEFVRDLLRGAGAQVIDVSLPRTEYAIAAYYILCTAEASSNLARFDGARYGFRKDRQTGLEQMYRKSRTEGFGKEVKRRIMLGTYVLSAGYYDAYYEKAQKVRTLIREDFDRVFEVCDVLLTPTSPTTAFELGAKLDNPLEMYLSDVYTVSVNLAGLPAISIPCGVDSNNLPIGAQLIGKPFDETTILQTGHFVEKHL